MLTCASTTRHACQRFFGTAASTFNVKMNKLAYPTQIAFAGTDALGDALAFAKANASIMPKKPLIVTDPGVMKAGIVKKVRRLCSLSLFSFVGPSGFNLPLLSLSLVQVTDVLSKHNINAVVFAETKANPDHTDISAIAKALQVNTLPSLSSSSSPPAHTRTSHNLYPLEI